ncbi:hypothetical protein MAM1_0207d08006 [Mucor ambiguus]|uniref:Uncharacterized protein n=1 Tax=Mucor ambiguus TaxID=91626 RepID=A0A0C9MLR7_9FUNG|nr:hypothetical protein MAM1_0207d08006 [Mucor ambiguus]
MSTQPVALFNSNVSTEIWGCIVANLGFQDRYNLAGSCKLMWRILNYMPYPEFANIDSSKTALGSFHRATLASVRLSDAKIDYTKLKAILSSISHLTCIDLTMIAITDKSATRIILCIPRLYRTYSVVIFVKGKEVDCFKNAALYMKERGVIIQSKRLLVDEEGDSSKAEVRSDLEESRKRRMRTPSPLRDDVFDLKEKIVEMKQTFGAINDNPQTIVPPAIKPLVNQEQYVDIQSLVKSDLQHEDPVNTKIAKATVKALAPKFLEGIAISSKGSFIFITEVEAYLRASQSIDDCANSTITLGFPVKPLFVIEQKREFRNQWLEAKIYYGKFEFLVTGCVYGNVNSTEVQAVLGASLGKAQVNEDYWRVYVPSSDAASVQDVRLLRDFTKSASGWKWRFKSKHFYDKGFSTASATNIQSKGIVAAGSLLLKMKIEKVDRKKELISLLESTRKLMAINFKRLNSRDIKALESLSLTKGKKLAVDIAVMVLSGFPVKNSLYLEMYKSLIASKMKSLNNKVIEEKKYLC